MADHRAENIVVEVVDRLTGLATTGSNIFRGRVHELAEEELPGLCVYQGPDNPRSDGGSSSWIFIDSDLVINVEAIVKDSAAQVETMLNQIRYELTQALQQDVTQGFSYVHNTTESTSSIEINGSGDKIVGRLRMEWVVNYRRQRYAVPAPAPVSHTILADGVSLVTVFDRTISSGSATLGFSRSVGTIDSGSYAGDTLTQVIPKVLAAESVGTLTYSTTTGTLSGADAVVASFGPAAITNNSTATGTWTSLGQSSVSYTAPSIAALNSTDIVFADRDNDALRLYRWGGASWAQVGNSLSVAMTHPGVVALNSTDFAWIDSSANELRTYRWNGTDFAQVGSGLGVSSVTGPQGIARLSATRIAHVNGQGDTLRAYDWNGSAWSAVGSGFGVGAAGNCSITALNSTDVVFVDSGGDALKLLRFNGSTWSQIGSPFAIANIAAPVVEAINSTDVAFYDTNLDKLRTYRWGGSTFAQVGSDLTVTSLAGRPWLTNMGSNRVAFVDDNLDVIRLYEWV